MLKNDISEKENLSNIDELPFSGLSSSEAVRRLNEFGKNRIIAEKKRSLLYILLAQFKSLMVLMLLIAAGFSFWLQEYLDAIAIIIVILINAIIGFWMEWQAEISMNSIKKIAEVPAKVIRDNKLLQINAEDVVPGDLLYLESGDMICADARIMSSVELMINESSLTGEAIPIQKKESELIIDRPINERNNVLFKGTFVSSGIAKAIVDNTGMKTELGKIAHLVQVSDQSATPLEKKLQVFSRKLILITVLLIILIFSVSVLTRGDFMEMFTTSIALAVAAIPEGLPIVATLALAQGMLKMARFNVIVKKLSAVETLGGTTVICTDKTGTLTQNKIEVTETLATDETSEKNKLLLKQVAVLCNTANINIEADSISEIGDPMETALLKYAFQLGVSIEKMRSDFPKIAEVPFSSEIKMMATKHQNDNKSIVFAKGASEEILKISNSILIKSDVVELNPKIKEEWVNKSNELAATGLRVIAAAYNETETDSLLEDLVFIGLYAMMDPPATGVKEAIEECKQAGIKVIMITGDHPATANTIAQQLSISVGDHEAILGKNMLPFEVLSEEDKANWQNKSVFARVSPAQKLDLIKVLQEKGHIVGMTGDGVNDAPALKKADIGIAMGKNGTQVAQEVSDMILKDNSFSSIVQAIKQGRVILTNIQKFVIYLLSCNMSELFLVTMVALGDFHFQLFPLQILFVNLITDVLPALALGVSPGGSEIMKLNPRNPSEPLIKKRQWTAIWIYSIVISVITLSAVFVSHELFHSGSKFDPKLCNNILFFTLIICQLLHVFNMTSANISFFKSEVFRNKYVWYALGLCVVFLLLIFILTPLKNALDIQPLHIHDWIVVGVSAFCSLLIIQFLKRNKIIKDEN